MDDTKLKEQYYTPPPKVGNWESFKTFLWNSETNQFLGRTAGSWAKIILFYVVFYLVLAAFFAVLMFLFFQTIDYNKPKWQLDRSLIGTNPGLGFRPTPPDTHIDSTLIWYKRQASNYALWVQKLDDFLQDYREPSFLPGGGQNIIQCSDGNKPPPGKVCAVNIHQLNPCIKETGYNYDKGSPCIFLKLNKIFGWEPLYYNDTKNLPTKMPADLKNFIIQEKNREPYKKLETVWVSCEGENPADIENIGPISYLPSRGFPGYYFPYINTEGYLSPVIAVWFESPARGVLINIECKAWAQNIHHDRHERRGSVHFELMID